MPDLRGPKSRRV